MDKIPDGKPRELVDSEKEKNKLLKYLIELIGGGTFEGVIIISVLNDGEYKKEEISGNYIFIDCSAPDSRYLLDSISGDVKQIIEHLSVPKNAG